MNHTSYVPLGFVRGETSPAFSSVSSSSSGSGRRLRLFAGHASTGSGRWAGGGAGQRRARQRGDRWCKPYPSRGSPTDRRRHGCLSYIRSPTAIMSSKLTISFLLRPNLAWMRRAWQRGALGLALGALGLRGGRGRDRDRDRGSGSGSGSGARARGHGGMGAWGLARRGGGRAVGGGPAAL